MASAAHLFGHINFDDLQSERYDRWRAYGQSKLANILFTYELARRLPVDSGCTVNCLHPGVVATELGRYLGGGNEGGVMSWVRPLVSWAIKTPEQGAETSIYLASSDEVQGVSGKYFVNKKETKSSAESYDVDVARKLWTVSEELVYNTIVSAGVGVGGGGDLMEKVLYFRKSDVRPATASSKAA